ncbi:MAG: asparaginase [SAR202 cluster bacterium]|nr:asparaginase [SAR202 cluster bacterium]|tara:strand:+ start:1037 stop:2044 length:1008 start_codon:yes stop_codon:yes gene_type:complete
MPNDRPIVRVIGTGGSIAGVGPDRMDFILYPEIGDHITIQQSLDRVPEIQDFAEVRSEDLVSVGSTAIGAAEWLGLAQRINAIFKDETDVAGVAVTHGTATLEETSYFLHLTVKSQKPVVITGAMRPPTALSTDSDLNLLDAVRTAASPDATGLGVLTVLNNEIQCGRDVTKANTFRVETFRPNELGFLGYADSDGKVVFYRAPLRRHTVDTPFMVDNMTGLPRVDIVYAYAGADGLLVDAVRNNRSDGLVLAGFGGGTFPPAVVEAAVKLVDDGIPVVLATRSTAGRVVTTPKKKEQGFLVSDNLLPQKARILLMLGLTVTKDRHELQQMFYEY